MMKHDTMNTFIRKYNVLKHVMLVVVLALFCVLPTVAKADYSIDAGNVGYTPEDSTWKTYYNDSVDNVSEALDELYLMTIEYKCLDQLTSNKGTLTWASDSTKTGFHPLVTEYNLVLDTFDQKVTFTAHSYDEYATVTGAGQYKIAYGTPKTVQILVTALNGETRMYTVHVSRAPFDESQHSNKLSTLTIAGYDAVLDPEFSSNEILYALPILNSEVYLKVQATAYDSHATVTITGDELIFNPTGAVTVRVCEPNLADPSGSTADEIAGCLTYTINYNKTLTKVETTFEYTGHYEEFIAPKTGNYVVELWGAQGGILSSSNPGGAGAYTKGTIRLQANDRLYVFVGESPREKGSTFGGWNGGGNSASTNSGGGGATDIRLYVNPSDSNNVWDNFNSLKSRIMVAAGGGGGGTSTASNAGGALNGLTLRASLGNHHGGGGAQDAGGLAGTASSSSATGGSFGTGGASASGGTGGGAGYYGGGGGILNSSTGYGGGGSSYISGYEGCNSISNAATASDILHLGTSTHYSEMVFTDMTMTAGDSTMPTHDGSSTMTGNTGHGYAKITYNDANNNNYLETLTVTGIDNNDPIGVWKESDLTTDTSFDTTKNDYYILLTDTETDVTVTARPYDTANATVAGDGPYHIPANSANDPVGPTLVPVTVTAESGEVRVYNLYFSRQANSNKYPNNITISGLIPTFCSKDESYCQLSHEFDKDIHSYNVTIPYDIRELAINVEKGHYFQTLSGEGLITIPPNNTTFTVIVTAEDGSDYSVYNYNVYRDMTGDSELLHLNVLYPTYPNPGEPFTFDPKITEYYMTVPNTIDKYVFNPTNEYVDNSVTDTIQLYYEKDDPAASSYVIGDGNLAVGQNQIQFIVVAQNGRSTTYTLNVYRERSVDAYLNSIELQDVSDSSVTYEYSPTFSKYFFNYKATVSKDVEQVNIVTTKSSDATVVTGDGVQTLNKGENVFNILATADAGNIETYKVTIYRNKDENTNMSSLDVLVDGVNTAYTPALSNSVDEYTVNAPIGANKATITVGLESEFATVRMLNNDLLRVGENRKQFEITAEDLTTRLVTVIINRPADTDVSLSDLTVKGSDNNDYLTFDSTSTNYVHNIMVENDITYVDITGTKNSALASLTGNGRYQLKVGVNTVNLVVTSESNASRTYTINVTRKANSNALLSSITVGGNVIVPTDGTFLYTVNVAAGVKTTSIYATAQASTTSITGTGANKVLAVGENTFELVTLAEDNTTTETYTIKVVRDASDNANLASLYVKEGRLNETFAPNVITYTLTIPYDITSITPVYTTEYDGSEVVVSGNTNLQEGENTVTVTVTAEDNSSKTYTITVTRQTQSESNTYLDYLTVDKGTLDPAFNKVTPYYEVNIPYTETSIVIAAGAENQFATVTGAGEKTNLSTGDNLFTITVTNTDNTKRDYLVNVIRAKNDDAKISSLSIDGVTLEFNETTYSYTGITTKNPSLTFSTITLSDPNASYVVTGNSFPETGPYIVTITVTAENGTTTQDYTFSVTKEQSNNANLKSLIAEGYTFHTAFVPGTTVYDITTTVPNNVATLNILAEAEDTHATITGAGTRTLAVGLNTLNIVVTAEDNTQKTYTINVTKRGSDNNKVNVFEVLNGTISPAYHDGDTYYNVTIPYTETSLDLNIVLDDATATYAVSGNSDLKVGVNTVRVTVTSESGIVKIITLNVTREEAISALLSDLVVSHYDILPVFDSNTFKYNVVVDNEVNALTFTKIATVDPHATYVTSGNSGFTVGMNVVTITVTSRDNSLTETYELDVFKQASIDNKLSALVSNVGTWSTAFDQDTLDYTVTVSSDVEEIVFTATPSSSASAITSDSSVTIANVAESTSKTLTKSLEMGDNKIEIKVTNEGKTRTYKINVIKDDEDNYLLTFTAKVGANVITLNPETFDPRTLSYIMNVPSGTENINFAGTISANATSTGLGDHVVALGNNVYEVVVTSANNNSRTYTFSVYRPASTDASITGIVPSSGTLDPAFDAETPEYTLRLGSDVANLSFTVNTADKFATVTGNEELPVPTGTSQRIIKAKAENNVIESSQYTINVIKHDPTDAYLKSLSVTGYTLKDSEGHDLTFASGTLDYYITVPNSVEALALTDLAFELSDPNASYTSTGTLDVTASANTVYEIAVTSYDHSAINTYRIHVTRTLSSDATVTGIVPSSGTLDPAFVASTTGYTVILGSNVESLSFTVNTANKFAHVSGNEAAAVPVGSSTREITVQSEDESDDVTYTITILRESPSNAYLSNLSVTGYSFKDENGDPLTFSETTLDYYITVPNSKTTLTPDDVVATAADPNASVNKGQTIELSTQSPNVYSVVVNSYDNSATVTYRIHVTRTKSSVAKLATLTSDKGAFLGQTFDPDTKNYDLYVYTTEETVTFSATVQDANLMTITSGLNPVTITGDGQKHQILVQAEDETVDYYEITIHPTILTDTGLNGLGLNHSSSMEYISTEFVLDPGFDSTVTSYDVSVPYEYKTLDLAITKQNNQQTYKIKVGDNYYNNDDNKYQINSDTTAVYVEVYDGLNVKTKEYVLNITRHKSRNAYLKALSIEGYTLDPTFSKIRYEYNIRVQENVTSIPLADITATPDEPTSQVSISGNTNLVKGVNDITISVISQSFVSKQYIVHVTKLDDNPSELRDIQVSVGSFLTLVPSFSPTTYEYNVVVPSTYDKATVYAVADDSTLLEVTGAGFGVNGVEYDLHVGVNKVTVTSKYKADNSKTSTYTLNLIKEADNEIDLTALSALEGTLSPVFDRSKTKYTMNVGEDVEHLTLTYTASSPNSTVTVVGNQNFVSGENKVSLIVQNIAKTKSKTYQITVNKAKSTNVLLKSLSVFDSINDYTYTPAFDATGVQKTYSLEVTEDVDKISVFAEAAKTTTTISGNGETYLNYGDNQVVIVATAEAGNTETYYVNIYRNYNKDLATLTVSEGTLSPTFDVTGVETNYTVTVPNDVKTIDIAATAKSLPSTAITGTGTKSLSVGSNNVYTIRVTDPNNKTKDYTVTVTREANGNNYLADLQVDGFITPAFDKEVTEYTVDVRKNVTSLNLTYSPEVETSTASHTGNSGFTQGANPNNVVITVEAENGQKKYYTLHVYVRDDDYFTNQLANLTVSEGTLTPDFNGSVNNYAVTVGAQIDSIVITATKVNELQTVTINGTETLTDRIDLEEGKNVITIAVTDVTGTSTRAYTVSVYRVNSADVRLKSLVVSGHNFYPSFKENTYLYNLTVDSTVDDLTVTAVPMDDQATVTIVGNTNLQSGKHPITIRVTGRDNLTYQDYIIQVNKKVSTNNYLESLSITGHTFSPAFTKTNSGPYVLNVASNVKNIVVNATPEAKQTTVTGTGLVQLAKGLNEIDVIATSESGSIRQYTILVNRAYSSESDLSSIMISAGTLTPTFGSEDDVPVSGVHNYTVNLEYTTEEITVTGIPKDSSAILTGNGTYDLKGLTTKVITLTSVSEDGTNTSTYTITINRTPEPTADLEDLTVKEGRLSPEFSPSLTDYSVLVPNDVEHLTISYVKADSNAEVVIAGNSDFVVGTNEVTITVTSGTGANALTKVYKLSVRRQPLSSNYLTNIQVANGTTIYPLSPTFNSSELYYETTVPMNVSTVTLSVTKVDESSIISSSQLGQKELKPGINRFYIDVQAASSSLVRTYQVVVNRTVPQNFLLTLTSDKGTLTPAFDKDTNSYELKITGEATDVTLSGTYSEGATVSGLGKINFTDSDIINHNIIVTGYSGDTNIYNIKITKNAEFYDQNTNLISLTPSKGTLSPAFANNINDYTVTVGDGIGVMSFTAVPASEKTVVTGTQLRALDYGNNVFTITVTPAEGTPRTITVTVVRQKSLQDIETPLPEVTLNVGDTHQLTYTLVPADAVNNQVDFTVLDSAVATVSSTGLITGVAPGTTVVTIASHDDPNISVDVVVTVTSTLITTNNSHYTIVRYSAAQKEADPTLFDYIIGFEPKSKFSSELDNFDNDSSMLFLYDSSDNLVSNKDTVLGTGAKIKLKVGSTVVDELTVIVRGDVSGEGTVNTTDFNRMKSFLSKKLTFDSVQKLAADVSGDGKVNTTDFNRMKSYLSKKLASFNS